MSFTFGAATKPAVSAAAPLFGAASTTTPSLFGATTTTPSMFGATATTASTTPSLFGAPAATTATPSLFGAPTSTATATPSLFGSTSTAAAPSLFGAPATSAAGSLFGAPTTATTSLFGATPAPAGTLGGTTPAVGLGGTAPATGTIATIGSGTTLGSTTSEKENVRDGEVPQIIVQLTQTIKNKLKENRALSDQFAAASSPRCMNVKERMKEVNHKLSDGLSRGTASEAAAVRLSNRSLRDLQLGKEAASVQESLARTNHHITQQHTVQHIIDLVREYDSSVTQYQDMVEQLTLRMKDIMDGKTRLSTNDLKEYLTRFDAIFSTVANKLFEGNSKVEELRASLSIDGSLSIATQPLIPANDASWAQLRGAPSFPSQSTLVQISAMIKPAQAAAAPAATGGLFGSAPMGGSLFSTAPASKPLFGATSTSGSLFPSLTTTTAQTTSLFPTLTTTKPATSFGSTLSTNTSGLLFSSKK